MNYIDANNQVVALASIRGAHPNMSIPDGADLTDIGYRKLINTPQPTDHNKLTQGIRESAPVEIDGSFEQCWEVFALDATAAAENITTAKNAAWERIMTERDRRTSLGVKVGSHWFHSDQKSRTQQLGLALLGPNIPVGLQWKTMALTSPPVFVPMTRQLAQAIVAATAASDTAIFTAAEVHRLVMEASEAPQDYDFSTGWPTSIEEEANAAGITLIKAYHEQVSIAADQLVNARIPPLVERGNPVIAGVQQQ